MRVVDHSHVASVGRDQILLNDDIAQESDKFLDVGIAAGETMRTDLQGFGAGIREASGPAKGLFK